MSTAASIIKVVRDQLHDTDTTNYRWSDAELLRYVNAAQKQVVFLRSDANAVEVVHSVTDTNPRRTIPSDGYKFIKVICNIATNGDRSGPVRLVQVDILDSLEPLWRSNVATTASADNFYSSYVFDPRTRKNFWLYPRPAVGRNVYIVYAAVPADLTTTSANLTLVNSFDGALAEYTLFRALQKEGRYSQTSNKPQEHWNTFLQMLGLNAKAYAGLVAEEKDISDNG